MPSNVPGDDRLPTSPKSGTDARGQASSWVPIGAVVAIVAIAAVTSLGPRLGEVFGW